MAEHASKRERIAVSAERDTTDLKKVEYMTQFVGDTFPGIISSVTGFGFFVELENGVEGLVHLTTLKDDYYDFVESRYALEGNHHHRIYQLGDEVEVILIRASIEEKALDFVVKDNCDQRALNMADSADRKSGEHSGRKSKSKKAAESSGKEVIKTSEKTGRKKTVKEKKKKTKISKRNKHDHKAAKRKKRQIIAEI